MFYFCRVIIHHAHQVLVIRQKRVKIILVCRWHWMNWKLLIDMLKALVVLVIYLRYVIYVYCGIFIKQNLRNRLHILFLRHISIQFSFSVFFHLLLSFLLFSHSYIIFGKHIPLFWDILYFFFNFGCLTFKSKYIQKVVTKSHDTINLIQKVHEK